MKADLRATLEAIAAGKNPAQSGPGLVDEAALRARGADFNAWHRFSEPQTGERLAAPAELLAPHP